MTAAAGIEMSECRLLEENAGALREPTNRKILDECIALAA